MSGSAERIRSLMAATDRDSWTVAALVLTLTGAGSPELQAAAHALLEARDIEVAGEDDPTGTAAQAAAPVLQAAAVLRGDTVSWADQSDPALLAQGRASAQAAAGFKQFLLPLMNGLPEALAQPGARMLDVGTGVAAMAVAYAELWPHLTVVGLDVLPRALALAAQTVSASTVADRVDLREQDVTTFTEVDAYDLGWLPAPFFPEPVLRAGVARVAAALRPGGWLVIGHGKLNEDPAEAAVSRFKTVAFGGTALDNDQAQNLLRHVGLETVATLPTPHGAPGMTVGRRPST